MAWLKEYDIIIDEIEEKITDSWKDVQAHLMSKLGLSAGDIGMAFKSIYPVDETINHYFKTRKAFRTMQAIADNLKDSNEEIAIRYGYRDYQNFFKAIKKLCGKKSPTDLINENYQCPPVMHWRDLLKSDLEAIEGVASKSRKAIIPNVDNEFDLVDRTLFLRDSISEMKKQLRTEKDPETVVDLMEEIATLEMKITDNEARLDAQLKDPVYIKNLTPGLYAEFRRIEECRIIYGIDIKKIIELYNQSVEMDFPLDVLCDNYCDEEFTMDDEEYYLDDEDPDMSYLEDEMNLEESWQYYNDDDAEDPYGRIEEPEEYY